MKKILVTGANGFIGRNLCARLESTGEYSILRIDMENTKGELRDSISQADMVFHLAGINRPKDNSEYHSGNVSYTEEVIRLLVDDKRGLPVFFSSSIQALIDNPYGKSKKEAELVIREYGKKNNAKTFMFRLPNVFGKWCRPNYNSVIATWCQNSIRNIPLQMNDPETVLSLVYIDDVIDSFMSALKGDAVLDNEEFCVVSPIYKKKLSEIAELIDDFKQSRESLVIPNMEDAFVRALYATWLSFLDNEQFGYMLPIKKDNRGWLSEFLKSKHLGQLFVSTTKPGITRGNHWHHTKVEKFLVVSGKAEICFREIDKGEITKYEVSGDQPTVVDIPPGYTHSITNTGDKELVTLFWADEIFNSEKPDTYLGEVRLE